MGSFTLDIKGQLNNMRLSEGKALWPLFEAVVNAIQAIEDSRNKDIGRITIFAKREKSSGQERIQEKGQKEVLERFESFTITDNDIGMDSANYQSFNTAYSTLKIKKGCKGIGRFLWLKAFRSVKIESIFQEDDHFFRREFVFDSEGVEPEDNITPASDTDTKTVITLDGFLTQYKSVAFCFLSLFSFFLSLFPVELDVIAINYTP